jgi:hypothetical protein
MNSVKRKVQPENLGVEGESIKMEFRQIGYDLRVSTGFIWLRIGKSGGHL